MSLFSPDKILINESSVKGMDIDTLGYSDDNIDHYSFVQEGYNAILEMNSDYIMAEKVFFESVLGSYGEDSIINESFSDFFDKIKSVIRKFIDWLKKIFKEFVIKINALVSSEKYIKKHHKLLYKFDTEDEFEYNGYKFTNVTESTYPLPNAVDAIEPDKQGSGFLSTTSLSWTSYIAAASGEDSGKEDATKTINDDITKKTQELEDSLDNFYDEFRGRVIGKSNEKIDSSDFADELFEFFRDGEKTPSSITITSTDVNECYRRFDGHKDLIKSIEKTQKAMIKEYEALEKYLDKMINVKKAEDAISFASASGDYVERNIDVLTGKDSIANNKIYSTSTSDKMNNYVKILSAKTSQMCQIHTQAFSAKLEAAKDMFKQDKAIIYKALQKIVKRTGAKE